MAGAVSAAPYSCVVRLHGVEVNTITLSSVAASLRMLSARRFTRSHHACPDGTRQRSNERAWSANVITGFSIVHCICVLAWSNRRRLCRCDHR
jgi:hypothetical protein